ncbi:IS3 family transposase [Peribacillus sp. V2I11]
MSANVTTEQMSETRRIKVKLKGMSPVDYRVHALKVA